MGSEDGRRNCGTWKTAEKLRMLGVVKRAGLRGLFLNNCSAALYMDAGYTARSRETLSLGWTYGLYMARILRMQ